MNVDSLPKKVPTSLSWFAGTFLFKLLLAERLPNKILRLLAFNEKQTEHQEKRLGAIRIAVDRVAAAMVREGDVVEGEEGAVLRQGLDGEDLDRRAHDALFAENLCKIIVIDHVRACGVDEGCGRLHEIKLALVEDDIGLLRPRVERNHVRRGEQSVEIGQGDVIFCEIGIVGRYGRVGRENVHVEGLKLFCDESADRAEADQTDGLVAKLIHTAEVREILLPDAVFQRGVCARHVTGLGDHEAEGQLGDRIAVVRGVIDDGDAQLLRRLHVDVFKPAAIGQNVFQIWRRLHEIAGNGAEVNHQNVRIGNRLVNLLRGLYGVCAVALDVVNDHAHFLSRLRAEIGNARNLEIGEFFEAIAVKGFGEKMVGNASDLQRFAATGHSDGILQVHITVPLFIGDRIDCGNVANPRLQYSKSFRNCQ